MATTTPKRLTNDTYRSREHLTFGEVTRLIDAAGTVGRYPERDRCLVLVMFRHGLRAGEAFGLRWDAVTFDPATVSIKRLKQRVKTPKISTHLLQPDEVEALQHLRQQYPDSRYVFPSERGGQMGHEAIARVVSRAGKVAKLPLPVHPHMLRHSCGYYLANKGYDTRLIQEWLGHANIQHTVRYTALNPERFRHIEWHGG